VLGSSYVWRVALCFVSIVWTLYFLPGRLYLTVDWLTIWVAVTGPMLNSVEHISWLVRERQRATIDGLEVGELLGRGSFGRVYKGTFLLPCLLITRA